MQIEYATDTVFRRREDLQRLYQPLVRTAVHAIKAAPVLKKIYSLNIMANLLRAANRRYEAFLCALEQPSVDLRHVNRIAAPVRKAGRSYHGFNLFRAFDLELFVALARGEHTINGLRNSDLRRHLPFTGVQVSRLLKRLRLHGLLKKVPRCHKYYLTALGRA